MSGTLDIHDPLALDYALTSKGQCKQCSRIIREGELRFTKKVRSRFHDSFDTLYYHWKCGKDVTSGGRGTKPAQSIQEFKDWMTIRWSDIEMCMRDLNQDKSQFEEFFPPPNNYLCEALSYLKKQNIWIWQIIDILKEAPIKLMRTVIAANQMFLCEDNDRKNARKLYEKISPVECRFILADAIVNGKLPKCPLCQERTLVQTAQDIICYGFFSQNSSMAIHGAAKCPFKFRYFQIFTDDVKPLRMYGKPVGDELTSKQLERHEVIFFPTEAKTCRQFQAINIPAQCPAYRLKAELDSQREKAGGEAVQIMSLCDSEEEDLEILRDYFYETEKESQPLPVLNGFCVSVFDEDMATSVVKDVNRKDVYYPLKEIVERYGGEWLGTQVNLRLTSVIFVDDEPNIDIQRSQNFLRAISAKIPILHLEYVQNLLHCVYNREELEEEKRRRREIEQRILAEKIDETSCYVVGRKNKLPNKSICGKYIREEALRDGKPWYRHENSNKYLYFFKKGKRWRISDENFGKACFAYNKDSEAQTGFEITGPWIVYGRGVFEVDHSVRVLTREMYDKFSDVNLKALRKMSLKERQEYAAEKRNKGFLLFKNQTKLSENFFDLTKFKGLKIRQRKFMMPYRIFRERFGDHVGKKLPTIISRLLTQRREKKRSALARKQRTEPEEGSDIISVDDQVLENYGTAEIYVDPEKNVYNTMLHMTNIETSENKFYLLQLFYTSNAEEEEANSHVQYFVLRKWGRVGESSTSLLNDFLISNFNRDLQAAVNYFRRYFEMFTGQPFEDRELLEVIPHMYMYISLDGQSLIDPAEEETDLKKIKFSQNETNSESAHEISCKLDPNLRDFLECILDQNIEAKFLNCDVEKSNDFLGHLSKQTIANAYTSLRLLEKYLNSRKVEKDPIKRDVMRNHIRNLTETYYTQIPQKFARNAKIQLLDTHAKIQERIEELENLEGLLSRKSLLDRIKHEILRQKTGEHYLDVAYRILGWKLSFVEPMAKEYDIVSRYLYNTQGPTHSKFRTKILSIFSTNSDDFDSRVEDNCRLLWHGSRSTNIVSILHHGLEIAPDNAPTSGYMFSKGIYFADCASKASQYSYASTCRDGTGVLFLCEVLCGNSLKVNEADCRISRKLNGKDSVYAVGRYRPDPGESELWKNYCQLPLGRMIENPFNHLSGFTELPKNPQSYSVDSAQGDSLEEKTLSNGESIFMRKGIIPPQGRGDEENTGSRDLNVEPGKEPVFEDEKFKIPGRALQYNEFVVYKTDCVRIKFCVFVKFEDRE